MYFSERINFKPLREFSYFIRLLMIVRTFSKYFKNALEPYEESYIKRSNAWLKNVMRRSLEQRKNPLYYLAL